MDNVAISPVTNKKEYSSGAPLPEREQWSKFESNRLLLGPRNQQFIHTLRFVTAGILAIYTPWVWVAVWLAASLGISLWLTHMENTYSVLLNAEPNPRTVTMPMVQLIKRYKAVWLLNALAWGCISILAQVWSPTQIRTLCAGILTTLVFLSIARTCFDQSLMRKVTSIVILSQFVGIAARQIIGFDKPSTFNGPYVYAFYLLLMSFMTLTVGAWFHRMHALRLDSEYDKLQLIQTLSQNQGQLHTEQQALVAANRLVQQFYSGAAHDLRQPVYAMQLYTEMLSDNPAQASVLLPKITQSCKAINDMFNTLFDFQQTHLNDTNVYEADINIKDTFNNLALHFQPIASAKNLDLRFKSIPGVIAMVPLHLIRILSNLITNAIRYTNAGGVLVGVRKDATHIRFEIWDTGIGISEQAIKHIFEEFYKAEKMEGSSEGLGLGLAIVTQLASRIEQAHISVQSRVGRGSVFKLSLPMARYHLP